MLVYLVFAIFLCHLGTAELNSPSVIIIGAGPAGIAAATRLYKNSIKNITVLEAEDRIGGRIHSVEFEEAIVELGAQYCHGEKGNIVYELARKFDIFEEGTNSFQNIYYSNGSKLNFEFAKDLVSLIDHEEEGNKTNLTGISTGEQFTHSYNLTLRKKYGNDTKYTQLLKEGLRFSEGWIIMTECAFSWDDISSQNSNIVCEGSQGITWKKVGYKTILEILQETYPDPSKKIPIDNRIKLNSKVEKIIWNENGTITVITSSKDSYSADYVIFTPSLGVLKKQKDSLFNPSLPISKQEAIEAIGFGGVIKVIINFPTKWWKDQDEGFSFFWSEEDIKSADFAEGPKKNGVSWITQFREITLIRDSHIWIGWFAGDFVPDIEKLSSEVLKNGCQFAINKFLGEDYNVSTIDKIIWSKWYSNENFLGTYSFVQTGKFKQSFTYQEDLAEPLYGITGQPVVLFAGEATNPVHYSTVHGAIESGFRETDRIIALHKKET